MLLVIISFIVVFVLFLLILSMPIGDMHKFIAEALLLWGYSYYLHKKYKIEYYYGMLMLKTKQGLDEIDKIAKYSRIWSSFADIGLVIAFGLLAPLMYRHINRRELIIGLATLLISAVYILPNLYPMALSVIALPYEPVSLHAQASAGGFSDEVFLVLIISVILLLGYGILTTLGLIYQAFTILFNFAKNMFFGGTTPIQPGASLLLPGINLPFIEGVIALLLLLFVHELMHAVLARVARVRLRSAGMLLFGFIPMGAFVDPDEEVLSRKSRVDQGRVIVAGSTANFALSFFSFIIFMLLISLPLDIYGNGVVIIAAKEGIPLEKGDVIYAINGTNITTFDDYLAYRGNVTANSSLLLLTNKGEVTANTDANGKIGVLLQPRIKSEYNWYVFLKNIFTLLFVLNFFVASVNLIPISLFDGHRLVELALGERHKGLVKLISITVGLALLINLLPWLSKF